MTGYFPSLPAPLAAALVGVSTATLRDWRRRGLLAPVGGTPRRPLYAAADVLAARDAPKTTRDNQRARAAA
ncbi:MAG: MerR family transcriptional regulator [Streptomyces sp.]|nr:MerR family transcriptional regulator [Streptomyces sp.]